MKTIVLNSTNIVNDGQNNKLVYNFPNSVSFKNSYIAITSISMFYSWFNITSSLANNTFTYTWVVGSTTTTYTVTIPDGLYNIVDINSYLQYVMIANGHYLIDSVGDYVYYAEFLLNTTRYAVQLNTYLVPISLPSGYSEPSNWVGYPTQTFNPSFTISTTFNDIIGFSAGFVSNQNTNNAYSPTTTSILSKDATTGTISMLSSTSPEVQPNGTILFAMSNINNKYSQPSSIIYSLTPTVSVGESISVQPPNFVWCKMLEGTYSSLRMTILGTDLQLITIKDPNMTIMLSIRDEDDMVLGITK